MSATGIFWISVLVAVIGVSLALGWRRVSYGGDQSYDEIYGMSPDPSYDYEADVRIALLEEFEAAPGEPGEAGEGEEGERPAVSGA